MSACQHSSMVLLLFSCTCLMLGNAVRSDLNSTDYLEVDTQKGIAQLGKLHGGEGVVVIDFGSYMIKAGVLPAEYDPAKPLAPAVMIRSTVQTSGDGMIRVGAHEDPMWTTEYPIFKGLPAEEDARNEFVNLKKIIEKVTLKLDLEDSSGLEGKQVMVILSAARRPSEFNEKDLLQKMAAMLFSTYQVHSLKFLDQTLLASRDAMTGYASLVINIGEDETYAAVWYYSKFLSHSRTATPLAIKNEKGCLERSKSDPELDPMTCTEQKWKNPGFLVDEVGRCCCGLCPGEDPYNALDGALDGWCCPLPQSIVDVAHEAVKRVDLDLRNEALENLVIAGGGANIKGLRKRFAKELQASFPGRVQEFGVEVAEIVEETTPPLAYDGAALLAAYGAVKWCTTVEGDCFQ